MAMSDLKVSLEKGTHEGLETHVDTGVGSKKKVILEKEQLTMEKFPVKAIATHLPENLMY